MPVTAPPLPQRIYRFDERIHVHKFCIDMLFSTILYNIKPKYHRGESTLRYFNTHAPCGKPRAYFVYLQSQTSGAPLRESSFRYLSYGCVRYLPFSLLFNPFSVWPHFFDVPLYFNTQAYMYMCMHMRAQTSILCMSIEVKVLQLQNVLKMHLMQTLV